MKPFGINLNPYKYRHPDSLAYDLRNNRGEFSINQDIVFERYFAYLDKCRARGMNQVINFVDEYKRDLKAIRKSVRKKVKG